MASAEPLSTKIKAACVAEGPLGAQSGSSRPLLFPQAEAQLHAGGLKAMGHGQQEGSVQGRPGQHCRDMEVQAWRGEVTWGQAESDRALGEKLFVEPQMCRWGACLPFQVGLEAPLRARPRKPGFSTATTLGAFRLSPPLGG